MDEFTPVNPKTKYEPVHLRISGELAQALEEAVEKTGIKRPDLIRQMICHCLNQIGIEVDKSSFERWVKKP